MIIRETPRLIVTDSICFALMYRCLACGQTVSGDPTEEGDTVCEDCGAPLDEDDEIAYRLEE